MTSPTLFFTEFDYTPGAAAGAASAFRAEIPMSEGPGAGGLLEVVVTFHPPAVAAAAAPGASDAAWRWGFHLDGVATSLPPSPRARGVVVVVPGGKLRGVFEAECEDEGQGGGESGSEGRGDEGEGDEGSGSVS